MINLAIMGVMAAGTLLKAWGDWQANQQQAEEERQNAEFFREQAKFAQKAGDRQASIFEDEADRFVSNQVGLFARNGIAADVSMVADSIRRAREGLEAIKEETAMNVRTALLKGRGSDQKADRLSAVGNNLLQAGGTLMTGAGAIISNWPKSGTPPPAPGAKTGDI